MTSKPTMRTQTMDGVVGSRIFVHVCSCCRRWGTTTVRHNRNCEDRRTVEYVAQIMGAR